MNYPYNFLLKRIENSEKIIPEFIDTYFLILEEMGDTKKIEEEAKKYILLFPDADIIKKWIKKYWGCFFEKDYYNIFFIFNYFI